VSIPDAAPFSVELARSGLVLEVPAHRTLLSVIRDVLPDAPSSCGMGTCGSCATRVLAGLPDHRDGVLSPEERALGQVMMVCVGRARSERLVLDL